MGSFGRDTELAMQLIHAGNSLLNPPSSVDALLCLLDEVETLLSNIEQAPATSMQDALLPSMKALISTDILKHQNVDVRVSVASCITEITRITAPDAPYCDAQMKEIFQLTVEAFGKLGDVSNRCYKKAELIVDTVSKVRSCLLMLDLECDELILEMFQHFFKITRSNSNHPPAVISAMETIMTMVIDESEEVSLNLLNTLLANVTKEIESVSPMSLKLGEKVLASCGHKLKSHITEALKPTGNILDTYSPVVATICQNECSCIEDHKTVQSEEHKADEKKSAKLIGFRIPLEGTMEQAPDVVSPEHVCEGDNSRLVVSDGKAPAEKNENLKTENSSNVLKLYSKLGQAESKDAETESETIQKKRGRKPNSLMNPNEGYNHSWTSNETKSFKTSSSKKPRKKITNSSSAKNRVSKKEPLSTETTICSTEFGQTVVISLPTPGSSLKGPRKRGWPKSSNTLPLSALKKEESGVQIEEKDSLLIDVSIKVEPEEEHDLDPKRKCSRKSGDATEKKKLVNKTNIQDDIEKMTVQVPVTEIKIKSTRGKLSLAGSDSKKKNSEDVSPVKVITEASGSKKMNSPVAGKSLGKGLKETPKGNTKRKQGARKEEDSKLPGLGEELVGRRIKVWWPLDKMFYEGVVDLYDYVTKKHRVLYVDGDTEVLNLKRQRWELIGNDALAKEDQEKDHPKSCTLSEILRKQKEKKRKRSMKQEKAGSSAIRSSTKDDVTGTDHKEKKDEDKSEIFTGKFETETKGSEAKQSIDPNSQKGSNAETEKPKGGTNPGRNETAMAMPEGKDGM